MRDSALDASNIRVRCQPMDNVGDLAFGVKKKFGDGLHIIRRICGLGEVSNKIGGGEHILRTRGSLEIH